jgi:methylmalonyl-CoA/ethylmalonyl-CoA epimerase
MDITKAKPDNFNSKVDHIAVAVKDLDSAVEFYRDVLGFELEARRETKGKSTGMQSAVMRSGDFSIVLIKGTDPDSQVTKYVENYGPGVQHVAFLVEDIEGVRDDLENKGMQFATNIIDGPGLRQMFSNRESDCGMMYEFIERTETDGFLEQNIQSLFNQLEQGNKF